MTTFILTLILRLLRWWVRLYTLGLPPDIRDTRRAEIESDVWEHQHDPIVVNRSSYRTATEIFGRLVWGIPADVSWRAEQSRSEKSDSDSENRNVPFAQKGFVVVAVLLGATYLALGVITSAQGGANSPIPDGFVPLVTGAMIFAGLRVSGKSPIVGGILVASGATPLGIALSSTWVFPIAALLVATFAIGQPLWLLGHAEYSLRTGRYNMLRLVTMTGIGVAVVAIVSFSLVAVFAQTQEDESQPQFAVVDEQEAPLDDGDERQASEVSFHPNPIVRVMRGLIEDEVINERQGEEILRRLGPVVEDIIIDARHEQIHGIVEMFHNAFHEDLEESFHRNREGEIERMQFRLLLELFDMEPEELESRHQEESIAAIGESLGIGPEEIVETLLRPVHDKVTRERERDNIGEEEAKSILREARENITNRIHQPPDSE